MSPLLSDVDVQAFMNKYVVAVSSTGTHDSPYLYIESS